MNYSRLKGSLIPALLSFSFSIQAQIYTPSGVVSGTSGNSNVGIGVTNPTGRLSIRSNLNTGGIHILTLSDLAGGPFGTSISSPYGLSVELRETNKAGLTRTRRVALIDATGRAFFGDVSLFPDAMQLNAEQGFQIRSPQGYSMRFAFPAGSSSAASPAYVFGGGTTDVTWAFEGAGETDRMKLSSSGELRIGETNEREGYFSVVNTGGAYKGNSGLLLRAGNDNSVPAEELAVFHVQGHQGNLLWKQMADGSVYLGGNNTIRSDIRLIKSLSISDVAHSDPTFRLFVQDGIRTERVKVDRIENWPDYVFGEGYDLMDLSELADYIESHGHLPHVESASKIEEEGYELQEMDKDILRALEEVTVHLISLNERVGELEERINRAEP